MAVKKATWHYVGKEIRSARDSKGRRLMRLYIVRGSFCTAQEEECPMDEAVWSKMPEDMLWEVLRFVPAAKRFQLQLVSRKWRKVLTSTQFRNTLSIAAAAGGVTGESGEQPRVVAYLAAKPAGANSRSRSLRKVKEVDIDLSSFVPSRFWKSDSDSYFVEAAADGLVCISNASGLERELCMLNPLTRTCTLLPKPPFQPCYRWCRCRFSLASGVLTMYHSHDFSFDYAYADPEHKVATYDLASGGADGWLLAPRSAGYLPFQELGPVTLCAGERYRCDSALGHVYLVDTAGDAAGWDFLDPPSVTLLGLDPQEFLLRDMYLVAHRGALFFVSHLGGTTKYTYQLAACGVWQLAREQMEWVAVALLEEPQVEQLTGLSCADNFEGKDFHVEGASGVREVLLCGELFARKEVDGWIRSLHFLLGFNLDSGEWEVVDEREEVDELEFQRELQAISEEGDHEESEESESEESNSDFSHREYFFASKAVELRPDLFLP